MSFLPLKAGPSGGDVVAGRGRTLGECIPRLGSLRPLGRCPEGPPIPGGLRVVHLSRLEVRGALGFPVAAAGS